VPQLDNAAPQPWVELNPADARDLNVSEGDLLEVTSPRGVMQARARICGVRPGVVFVPFHYGYFDVAEKDGTHRAANELTITAWDPVSKQPLFKVAAVRVSKLADGTSGHSSSPTIGGSAPLDPAIPATIGGPAAQAASEFGQG
jgi:anaerobic selenocysteine-containing dehydrogenase